MSVLGSPRSLFALLSPKLWTALNQYGSGKLGVTEPYEQLLAIKFEDVSLDQFKRVVDVVAGVVSGSIKQTRGILPVEWVAAIRERCGHDKPDKLQQLV